MDRSQHLRASCKYQGLHKHRRPPLPSRPVSRAHRPGYEINHPLPRDDDEFRSLQNEIIRGTQGSTAEEICLNRYCRKAGDAEGYGYTLRPEYLYLAGE